MARSHIHKTPWRLPAKFADPMQLVQKAVDELKRSAGHDFLKFTLDGRLLGDLGEAIAEHFFSIKLHNSQKTGHDGTLDRDGVIESVEIKARQASTTMWFDSEPDQLIAFRLENGNTRITLAYAGSGSVLRKIRPNAKIEKTIHTEVGAKIQKYTARQTVSINQLAEHFKYEHFMVNPTIPFRNRPTVA